MLSFHTVSRIFSLWQMERKKTSRPILNPALFIVQCSAPPECCSFACHPDLHLCCVPTGQQVNKELCFLRGFVTYCCLSVPGRGRHLLLRSLRHGDANVHGRRITASFRRQSRGVSSHLSIYTQRYEEMNVDHKRSHKDANLNELQTRIL